MNQLLTEYRDMLDTVLDSEYEALSEAAGGKKVYVVYHEPTHMGGGQISEGTFEAFYSEYSSVLQEMYEMWQDLEKYKRSNGGSTRNYNSRYKSNGKTWIPKNVKPAYDLNTVSQVLSVLKKHPRIGLYFKNAKIVGERAAGPYESGSTTTTYKVADWKKLDKDAYSKLKPF